MPRASWTANHRNEYWIDVLLGGSAMEFLIDTGLIDSHGVVGFSIDAAEYDRVKNAGGFSDHQKHIRLMANGQIGQTESGALKAQLISPQSKSMIGPVVDVYVYRGAPGVPDRVGLAFFHLLKGCAVVWDLDQRLWQIDCP
jgi:hypothetical protein